MSFVFNRIDSRFIHGQVGARLVREFNVGKVIIVDDKVAADEFMKMVFKMASVSCPVDVYSVEEAIAKHQEGAFESGRFMLLFGNVDCAYRAYQGIHYSQLDVGSIKGDDRPGTKAVINLICITDDEAMKLKEMKDAGCNVYFQSVPDTPIISIEDGLKNIGL